LCGGFSKQQLEIIKKKVPKATFADFQSCGIFHSPSRPPTIRPKYRNLTR
jgi:hypothetical protein